ncbi:MAG TPA: phosphate ABC transporter permease PstA [Thermomicrobiales bacterium]|jgi:phosphate transport system permease protein|nr:phosphate ABC transporter permease PstA [Thermomicrobiales bacterium]
MSSVPITPDSEIQGLGAPSNLPRRKVVGAIGKGAFIAATVFAALILVTLLARILFQGIGALDMDLLTNRFTSNNAINNGTAGFRTGIISSLWLVLITAAFAIPVGVGAAIYLEEYAPDNWFTKVVQVNVSNLSGVPSVVYGLLGLGVFVSFFGFNFLGRSVLAGGLTLGLLVLPIIIIAAQEALRAVPSSLREAAYALGATPWQVTWHHVLPAAMSGILTGTILSVARAIGETAPVLVAGAATAITLAPSDPLDGYSPLPLQVFDALVRPQASAKEFAAAGIIIMMALLLTLNLIAIVLRERANRKVRW